MTAHDSTDQCDLAALIAACRSNPAPLTTWEREFLAHMAVRRWPPTKRQLKTLEKIAARERPDFTVVNQAARQRAQDVCRRLLPEGTRQGKEWVCGSVSGIAGRSLRVRLDGDRAGAWFDHATGDGGGDFVSLAAAVAKLPQFEAAQQLARMLGLAGGGAGHG